MKLLRLSFEDIINDTKEEQLPIVYQGPIDGAAFFVANLGYNWQTSRRYLYGGFWYRKPDSILIQIDTDN